VMRRQEKNGLGHAYRAGLRKAIDDGAEICVQMDADLSHDPAVLPALISNVEHGADLAIGSRYVPGGSIRNWPAHRQLISRGGNLYVRVLLGIPLHDATAGYRAYRTPALEKLGLDDVESQGYCFQIDLTWRAVRAGLRVEEVPIEFVEREIGSSKMNRAIFTEAMWRVLTWGTRYRLGQLTGKRRRSAVEQ